MNISVEVVLGFVTAAGGALTAAVVKMWLWIDKRVQDCEADRTVLHTTIGTMSKELQTINRTVGQMESQVALIKERNDTIDRGQR